jgi:hypothetical protein
MFMFYINRLLVMSFDGGYGHVHVLSTSCYKFWRRLRPCSCFIWVDFLPWPLMVVCDDDRILPNKFDPFDWFIPNLLDGLTWRAILTMPRVDALRVVPTSRHKHGSHATMLAFLPNWLDLLLRVISNLLDRFLLGATSTTSRVAAPRVVSTT